MRSFVIALVLISGVALYGVGALQGWWPPEPRGWLGGGQAVAEAAAAPAESLTNQLTDHPSPYLAMHADNPVAWQEWGESAIAHARAEGKLMYLSIGYFSCHWCHVMERESYQDEAIAGYLNSHFVPVKVDRELQPALDARMQEFIERTRGYAGWPLNVFLTPDGYPLYATVYEPPKAFRDLLERLNTRWQKEPERLRGMAEAAADELRGAPLELDPRLPEGWAPRLRERLIDEAMAMADTVSGGFGQQNKFPQVPQLAALLDAHADKPREDLGEFLRVTLDNMARGGLYDHLGGGFFRYATDPTWEVPHFEKMLYDNALLAELYLDAGAVFDEPRYTTIGRRTLDFLLDVMRTDDGTFIASLSAVDDQGVEGGYYLWRRDELERLLSDDERAVAERVWGFDGPPELEHGHLPMQAMTPAAAAEALELDADTVEARLARARKTLLDARGERGLPRDDKRIAAWNGLVLRALARGATLTDGGRYREAAKALSERLSEGFWRDGALRRARVPGREPVGDAGLEDYAYVASGLVAWARQAEDRRAWALAGELVEAGWKRFFTPRGWRLSAALLIPYAGADPVVADGPTPSPSSLLVAATLAIARQTEDPALHERARAALNVGHELVHGQPFWFASQIRVINSIMGN